MLGFKRLAALAVTIGTLAGGRGTGVGRARASGQLAVRPAAGGHAGDGNIIWFHDGLLIVITAIALFVLALLIIIVVRFNARANPTPSRTTHNTLLEVAWTLIPVLILVAIAIPSFRLLFLQLNMPAADLTVKATGKQWYWTYSYPDNGKFEFELAAGARRDQAAARPAAAPRRRQRDGGAGEQDRAGADHRRRRHPCLRGALVRHQDRRHPGPLNETWFKATREGLYYGQCSELCGKDHAYMPIAVRVVSEEAFNTWVEEAKKKFARRTMPRDRRRARSRPPPTVTTRIRQRRAGDNDSSKELTCYGRTAPRATRPMTRCTSTATAIRPAGGASSIRPTTRTSARCTWCLRSMGGLVGGVLSIGMRMELMQPGLQILPRRRTCSTCSPPRTA